MRVSLSILFVAAVAGAQAQVWEKVIAPGLTYRMEVDPMGPKLINALRYSPGAPGLKLLPELAGGTINEEGTVKGRLTPGQVAKQAGAAAAINADFFNFNHGAPVGLTVRNGELLNTPFRPRSVLGWGQEAGFGIPQFRGSVTNDSGLSLSLESINQPVGQNQAALYSPATGFVETSTDSIMALISVEDAAVKPNSLVHGTIDVLLSDTNKVAVGSGKLLLVARGNKASAVAALRPGGKVKIEIETAGFDWAKVQHAVGGGPFLLRDGAVQVDALAQGFNAAFSDSRHPRTAVGKTKEGDLWFVTIDGRQPMSIGASLVETAVVMQRLGCVDAMNFDGGGSTNLHVRGVTVNRPSDKAERPVSNVVLFFAPQPDAAEGPAQIVVPASVTVGDQFVARLQLKGVEIPHSEIIWGMQGAGWIDQGGTVRAVAAGKATITAAYREQITTVEIEVKAKPGGRSVPNRSLLERLLTRRRLP